MVAKVLPAWGKTLEEQPNIQPVFCGQWKGSVGVLETVTVDCVPDIDDEYSVVLLRSNLSQPDALGMSEVEVYASEYGTWALCLS